MRWRDLMRAAGAPTPTTYSPPHHEGGASHLTSCGLETPRGPRSSRPPCTARFTREESLTRGEAFSRSAIDDPRPPPVNERSTSSAATRKMCTDGPITGQRRAARTRRVT